MVAVLVAEVGLTVWLGLYLLVRDPRSVVGRRTAAGLLGYAVALAAWLLAGPGEWLRVLACVPAVAWAGAGVRLLPEAYPHRDRLDAWWRLAAVPLAAVAAVAAMWLGGAYWLLAAVVLGPLLALLVIVGRVARRMRPAPVGGLLAVATLFFSLGAALLVLPAGPLPAGLLPAGLPVTLLLVSIDVDLLALGVAVAWCAAFDAGEALRRDMLRSLLAATGVALVFGGQVALAMIAGPGASTPLVALLLGSVAAAVAVQVLAGPVHGLLDRLVFAGSPELARQRAQLADAAAALPRRDEKVELGELEAAEFARLTRRALSAYGDLARLTASPLTNLPLIDERLALRRAPDQPLERATELKAVLLESIQRLKPRGAQFGTTEEWRYYNALYFPYVLGLRPYRRTVDRRALDPVTREAFDWFVTQVPERTLHNWQNAAARLIAADLSQTGWRSGRAATAGETGSVWQ